jgi:predicted RNase H-like HicB family nuclease
MVHYVGILDGDDDVWGVRIPDLPGCHGGGATAEEAIRDAASAAREWVGHMGAKSVPLPRARTLGQIIVDGELDAGAGETAVMVPVLLDQGRMVRANLSLDAGLLASIDEAARVRGLTRSAFVASAVREKILGEA